MQSRYYNPEWGRFINADGITGVKGDLLSHNMFAYCENNPVNEKDEHGFRSSGVFDECGGAETVKKSNLKRGLKTAFVAVKSFEAEVGVGIGMGAGASAQFANVPVSLSGVAKNDILKYKGSGGKNDLGSDFSASLGYAIGPLSHEIGTGKFHSYLNKSNECSCDFLNDSLGTIYNCIDSKPTGMNNDVKLQVGASLYIILGGNVSGSINLTYFFNETKRIWRDE